MCVNEIKESGIICNGITVKRLQSDLLGKSVIGAERKLDSKLGNSLKNERTRGHSCTNFTN